MSSAHSPALAVLVGRDPRGNYLFQCESGSTPGLWYHCAIWQDGSGGVCDCPASRRGPCTLVREAPTLKRLADVGDLIRRLLDTAAYLRLAGLGCVEGYDEQTVQQVQRLRDEADHALHLLGG